MYRRLDACYKSTTGKGVTHLIETISGGLGTQKPPISYLQHLLAASLLYFQISIPPNPTSCVSVFSCHVGQQRRV